MKYCYLHFYTVIICLFQCTTIFNQVVENGADNSNPLLLNNKCELTKEEFGTTSEITYIGNCRNGKANGWGEIRYESGYKKGFFKDNKIDDFRMEEYSMKTDSYIIGPNKGYKFHGLCVNIKNCRVSLENFSNGQYIGNSPESFTTNTPTIIYDETVPINDYYASNAKHAQIIPGTNYILVCDASDGSSDRRFLLNLENNKIIWKFGNKNSTYRIGSFIGFFEESKSAFFTSLNLNGSINKSQFIKINYENGSLQVMNKLPIGISIKDDCESNHLCIGTKYFKDGSFVKIENIDNNESGFFISKFSKNDSLISKREIIESQAHEFSIDQSNDRLALLFTKNDSTFLSYYNTQDLTFINNIYRKPKNKSDLGVELCFSPNKGYLIQKSERGSFIYIESELLMALPGVIYGFNASETTVISNDRSTILAFNIEKRSLIWRFQTSIEFKNASGGREVKGGSDYYNSGYYLVDNDFVLVTGLYPYVRIIRIKIPEENDLISNFIEQDYIKQIEKSNKMNDTEKQEIKTIVENKEIKIKSNANYDNNLNFDPSQIIWKKINNGKEVHHCYWCNQRVYPRKKNEFETSIPQINEFTIIFLRMKFILNTLSAALLGGNPYVFEINLYEFDDFCSRKCKTEYEYYRTH